jgi:hypothetical protein
MQAPGAFDGLLDRSSQWRASGELAQGGIAVEADQHGRAPGAADGLDPFGRRSENQAWNPQPGRFALDAARVGQYGGGVQLQRK